MGSAAPAIHDGHAPDPTPGAVNVPIFLTSAYQQQEIGKNKGHGFERCRERRRSHPRTWVFFPRTSIGS